jgi:hypothetical protein
MSSLINPLPFWRTCKEVVALVIAQEDRPLPLQERLALRLHLSICKTCPIFRRQVLTMRNAMKQWRHYGSEDTPQA